MTLKVKLVRSAAALSAAALLTTLTACNSSGSSRIAMVGPQGPAGATGAQGATGAAGPRGAPGQDGEGGQNGLSELNGESGLDGVDALATGGLVGDDGLGGTGLLADTGNPDNINPVEANLLIAAGDALTRVAADSSEFSSPIDDALPGGNGIVGTVASLVGDGGQALSDAGSGNGYLVDDVVDSTNQLATVTLGDSTPLGDTADSSLVGVSVLSSDQNEGELLTVGLSEDDGLTLDTPLGGGGDGTAGLGDTLGGVTSVIGSGDGTKDTSLDDTVSGVTGLLGGR